MITNPCNLSLNPSNTGIECQAAMLATAMNIMVPRNARWTQADIDGSPYNGSLTAFITAKTLLPPAERWFPLNGFAAPINSITESNESDVTETLDDGSQVFVRYGKYNRTFITTGGGLCFASHLMRFPQGYSFIEVDQDGKVQWYEPTPGTYAGVPLIMFKGLSPTLSTFSTVYKNRYMMVFDPVAYIEHGKIFATDSEEDVLGIQGLLDVVVAASTVTTQTITTVFVTVKTECADTNLATLYPGTSDPGLIQLVNFILHNEDGTVNTPSAIALVGDEVRFTGTFATGTDITVALAAASVLAGNGVSGYEGVTSATVAIP